MKKRLFLSFFILAFYSATAQNYYMSAPEGFGANTTGGAGGSTVTVTNYTDFYNAINSNKPTTEGAKIILVSGTITCPYTSVLIKNKTIIGLPGAKLVNIDQTKTGSGILYLKGGSDNVIIRNLIFEGPGAWDIGGQDNLAADGATNLWIDHCDFQDGIDGNFDLKNNADNITVSWCKFGYNKPPTLTGYESGGTPDHRFSDLIGSGSTNAPTDGHFSVTFQNCYWAEGCKERMPRARNAELHILNCYYNTSTSSSVAIGLGGGTNGTTCYVENTNFAQIKNVYKNYDSSDGGTSIITYKGSIQGASSTPISDSQTATTVPYTSYSVMSVEDVATYVPNATCGAGATLNVTADGTISACTNLGTKDYTVANKEAQMKLFPTTIESSLNVYLSDNVTGEIFVDIYTVFGTKVFSYTKKDRVSGEKITFDLADLATGVYLCTVRTNETTLTSKFIKD
ncbi:T9SS type A sorting domain-containing protein [Flavobacterium sp.]|uniref:pectate lyase family protein n=1 Tax=Flavobacterium sp. TaxID=239 RepID=UPI002BEFA76D|nr:T9SS type A sorting domain-containing protein [Flavobacterium sp.]HSD08794.1 T9SS type A sorting domain-containing protein [Flavobacterium sp.]